MSEDRRLQPQLGMPDSAATPPKGKRFQTRVRTLIVPVALCGVLLWAARRVWESQHPAVAAAHGLQARSSFERVNATRHLVQLVFIALSSRGAHAIDIDAVVVSLAASLSDPEENVRLEIIYALACCGSHVAIAPPRELVAALKDESAKNRAAAVSALAGFQCSLDPWVPSLLRSLEHDESQVREACGLALNRDNPPAVSAAALHDLIEALGSRSRFVRYFSARALLPHALLPETAGAIPALLSVVSESTSLDKEPRGSSGAVFDERPLDHDPVQVAIELLGRLAPGTASAGKVIAALTSSASLGAGHG